jgi:hypothetical protein
MRHHHVVIINEYSMESLGDQCREVGQSLSQVTEGRLFLLRISLLVFRTIFLFQCAGRTPACFRSFMLASLGRFQRYFGQDPIAAEHQ